MESARPFDLSRQSEAALWRASVLGISAVGLASQPTVFVAVILLAFYSLASETEDVFRSSGNVPLGIAVVH